MPPLFPLLFRVLPWQMLLLLLVLISVAMLLLFLPALVNFAHAEFHSWLHTSLFTFQIKNHCNWSYRAIGRYRSDLYYLVVDCDYFVLYTKRLFVEIV